MKPQICPFYEKCDYAHDPESTKCDKNYGQCQWFSWLLHQDTIPLPLICPLFYECGHQSKRKSCCIEAEEISDYRDCEHFSKWFWKLKVKGVR